MVFWSIPQNGIAFDLQTNSKNESIVFAGEYQVQVNRKFPLVIPSTIKEFKKYHKRNEPVAFSRGLAFSSDVDGKELKEHIYMKMIPRSGSHAFVYTFEEILGEFFSTTPQSNSKKKKESVNGVLKQDISHTYFVWNHHSFDFIKRKEFLKIIQTIRDPIEVIDSRFHLETAKKGEFKLPDRLAYWEHPLFLDSAELFALDNLNYFQFLLENQTRSQIRGLAC